MTQNKYTTNNDRTIVAVSNADGETPVYLYADPATHSLLVTASLTPSGTQDVNLTKVGGTTFSLGQQLAASSLPVVLTASQLGTLTPLSTVAVTQSTSPWVVSLTSTAISSVIPGSGNTNLGAVVGAASGATKTGVLAIGIRDDVLGTLTPADNNYTEGLRVDSTGAHWVHVTSIDSPVTTKKFLGTTTATTNVAGSATVVTLLASNTSRIKATIYNDSSEFLYIKEGSAASLTSFDYVLQPSTASAAGGQAIIDDYNGIVTGIWSAAAGFARIGETTP